MQSLEADVTREELGETLCTSSVSDIEMKVDLRESGIKRLLAGGEKGNLVMSLSENFEKIKKKVGKFIMK